MAEIPDAAVEAAARVLWEQEYDSDWKEAPERKSAYYRSYAQDVIAAAQPWIAAAALRAFADDLGSLRERAKPAHYPSARSALSAAIKMANALADELERGTDTEVDRGRGGG